MCRGMLETLFTEYNFLQQIIEAWQISTLAGVSKANIAVYECQSFFNYRHPAENIILNLPVQPTSEQNVTATNRL